MVMWRDRLGHCNVLPASFNTDSQTERISQSKFSYISIKGMAAQISYSYFN